ncbi:MAG: fimbrial protein, partial [Alistipes sp.]|nr:fimbrial protein [Alistipes sp.]
ALSVLAASCSKNEGTPDPGKEATRTVSLAGKSTRAVIDEDDQAAVEDLEENENLVNNFTAFVFNANTGRLEAKGSPSPNALSVTIPNLNTATPKRVVVLANTSIDIQVGGNYSELSSAVNFIDLDTQEFGHVTSGGGMAMYGEETVSLNEGTNSKTIYIDRLAAKVKVSKVTVTPDPELGFSAGDLQNFKLTGVTMQKVVGKAGFLGGNDGVLYGGIAGGDNASTVQKDYLADQFDPSLQSFTQGQTRTYNNFFYVLPNDGVSIDSKEHYTMVALVGEYYGEVVYFPVEIKDEEDVMVKMNTTYTLEFKIKDLGGSPGPEIPKGEAELEVNVVVNDWHFAPTQQVEW